MKAVFVCIFFIFIGLVTVEANGAWHDNSLSGMSQAFYKIEPVIPLCGKEGLKTLACSPKCNY